MEDPFLLDTINCLSIYVELKNHTLCLVVSSVQKAMAGIKRINLDGLRWRVFDARGQVLSSPFLPIYSLSFLPSQFFSSSFCILLLSLVSSISNNEITAVKTCLDFLRFDIRCLFLSSLKLGKILVVSLYVI